MSNINLIIFDSNFRQQEVIKLETVIILAHIYSVIKERYNLDKTFIKIIYKGKIILNNIDICDLKDNSDIIILIENKNNSALNYSQSINMLIDNSVSNYGNNPYNPEALVNTLSNFFNINNTGGSISELSNNSNYFTPTIDTNSNITNQDLQTNTETETTAETTAETTTETTAETTAETTTETTAEITAETTAETTTETTAETTAEITAEITLDIKNKELNDMGFSNNTLNKEALIVCNNNIEAAINYILENI